VPFLRFSRDKRGYEHIYLVHDRTRRGKPSRPRVLYWYRTPPGIRVGRQPFDEDVRRRLEAQNPDVTFDWPTIIATPIPPPAENEQWRERRRAERAARQTQRAEEASAEREAEPIVPDAELIPSETTPEPPAEFPVIADEAYSEPPGPPTAEVAAAASEHVVPEATPGQATTDVARRRRRRGGRRRRGTQTGGPGNPMASPAEGASNEPSIEADATKTFEPNDE
jgi:hypothetical protein